MNTSKRLVKHLLEHADKFEWTIQGLGMLRMYLDDAHQCRLHVWDSRGKVEDVSELHTHPWAFTSKVIAGQIQNERFLETYDGGFEFNRQQILCGVGGHLEGEPEKIWLVSNTSETYISGDEYSQTAEEIHRSSSMDGTVTIIKREFGSDVDHAFVYWSHGEWVSAEPRPATTYEIQQITQASLKRFFM